MFERGKTISHADILFRSCGRWRLMFISALSREARKRERAEKDGVESRGRAEALALELRERKQEAFLLEQRMQRMDAIAKEQRVRPPRLHPCQQGAAYIIRFVHFQVMMNNGSCGPLLVQQMAACH